MYSRLFYYQRILSLPTSIEAKSDRRTYSPTSHLWELELLLFLKKTVNENSKDEDEDDDAGNVAVGYDYGLLVLGGGVEDVHIIAYV